MATAVNAMPQGIGARPRVARWKKISLVILVLLIAFEIVIAFYQIYVAGGH